MLPPERKIQQVPDLRPLACRHQLVDCTRVEEIRLFAERVKFLARSLAELSEEPLIHRHTETLLLSIDDAVGNQTADRALQNVLQLTIPCLHRGGNAHR